MTSNTKLQSTQSSRTQTLLCVVFSLGGLLASVGVAYALGPLPVHKTRHATMEVSHCTVEGAKAVIGPRGTWKCYLPE